MREPIREINMVCYRQSQIFVNLAFFCAKQ